MTDVETTHRNALLTAPRGVACVFTASGVFQASLMSRLPAVRDRFDIDLGGVGLALGMLGIGTLAGMLLAGRVCRGFGSRQVVLLACAGGSLALASVAVVSPTRGLSPVLVVVGLAVGVWDAGMNIQASAVERSNGTRRMTRFHGYWSLGTLLSALLGVAAARAQVPILVHFGIIAAVAVGLGWYGSRSFVDERALPPSAAASGSRLRYAPRVLALGALILAGATLEGAASDWLAIYLTDARSLSHAGAALGYATFVGAMAAGRLFADRIQSRFRPTAMIMAGAGCAAVGVMLAIVGATTTSAYAGAALWGLGVCVVFPAALSASGHASRSGQLVALMTTVGYSAGLVGPACIGALAHRVGLQSALLALLGLVAAIVLLARSVVPPPFAPAETLTPAQATSR